MITLSGLLPSCHKHQPKCLISNNIYPSSPSFISPTKPVNLSQLSLNFIDMSGYVNKLPPVLRKVWLYGPLGSVWFKHSEIIQKKYSLKSIE